MNMSDSYLICLRNWHYAGHMGLIDMAQRSRIELLEDKDSCPAPCRGFMYVHNSGLRIAVFSFGHRMRLQIEDMRWDWLLDEVRVRWRRSMWRKHKCMVSISACREQVLRISYRPPLEEDDDVTLDALDKETSDWWLWLGTVVDRNRDALVEQWEQGI